MSTHSMLIINAKIQIPDEELEWTYSRSSGPGGQNVNKVNSKATVRWNVRKSSALPADVRERFLNAYGSRITNEGELLVTSQESRDQPKNIEICREKLAGMIRSVLVAPKKRKPTRPTKGSQFRRVEAKKRRSAIKQGRRSSGHE